MRYRFLILLFLILPFVAFPATRGWLCRVTLSPYQSVASINPQTGETQYSAAYTDANDDKYYIVYYPNNNYPSNSVAPSLATLGLTAYKDLSGRTPPFPPTSTYLYYLVQPTIQTTAVDDGINVDLSPIGDLTRPHGLGPIYQSDLGVPYLRNDYGQYNGVNPNFDSSKVVPTQGRDDSNSPYIVYNIYGLASSSDTQQGYYYVQNGNGGYELMKIDSPDNPSGSGTVDLTPVISGIDTLNTSINSADTALRNQLIEQLGAAGNSWVYDCKLSLDDLKSLANSLNISVSEINLNTSSLGASLDDANFKLSDISSGVGSIDMNLTTANENLSSISSSLGALGTAVESGNSTIDSRIGDLIDEIHDANDASSIPTLPLPDFGDTSPDNELPFRNSNWATHAQAVYTRLSLWGGSPSSLFKKYDVVSDLLNRMIGPIPSVGSDPVMFTIHWDIPYLGVIDRTFSFADYDSVPFFRLVCLYFLYVFFALAIAKLIMNAFI